MANKIKHSIENSKRKRDFKARNKRRHESKKKKNQLDEYVQRKAPQKEEAFDDVLGEEDEELERELARDQEMNDDNFDESEFRQYGEGLNLPSEEEESEEENEQDLKGEVTDSDLEDYYKELGIQDE